MRKLPRFGRFALVGALGMAVQLTALALLNRAMPGHYLRASVAATELAILHNFTWHLRYTWSDRTQPDRGNDATRTQQLLRFHLSNGLVSLTGNFILMRLLVQHAHLPLLPANLLAIAACAAANFALADLWAFTSRVPAKPGPPHLAAMPLILMIAGTISAHAQTDQSEPLPDTASSSQTKPSSPPKPPLHRNISNDSYFVRTGYMCGLGASTSPVTGKPAAGCGLGFTFLPLPLYTEIGIMAPQANRSNLSGYVSVDGSIPLARTTIPYLPLAIVGYSRLFETGHAIDYGLALAIPHHGRPNDFPTSLRLELRDYWTFANPTQHNIMLRIGWMSVETD